MQQLKLLNFYKILANIATKLVGAFIPLIVLQATGSIAFGALSLVLMYSIRILFNFAFKKFYVKFPQIILLLRLIPVVLYSFSIILIEVNLWLGVIGAVVFYGLSESFKSLPQEILFNYSFSDNGNGKSPLGMSRLIEQIGVLLALIVGGALLDVNKTLVIIISIVIYSIAVVPLVIYYIKGRNEKTFNKDAVSNARLLYEKSPELNQTAKKISTKILWLYAITYFVFCIQDVLGNAFNIHIFLQTNSFGTAGYVDAVYNAFYGIGCYIFSYIDSKKETTPLIIFSCIGSGLLVLSLVFISNFVWYYIAMGCAGMFYGFICTYALARLLPKCRIMGVSNEALFFRENSSNVSVIFAIIFGAFGSMIPVLVCNVIAMLCSAVLIPVNEEMTRKQLIKYLQNHEKAMSIDNEKENENKSDIVVVNVERYRKKTQTKNSVKKKVNKSKGEK